MVAIIWEGEKSALADFFQYCNNNDFGIEFTMVQNRDKLVFLDLELFHENGEIHSKTRFKPTAATHMYIRRVVVSPNGRITFPRANFVGSGEIVLRWRTILNRGPF